MCNQSSAWSVWMLSHDITQQPFWRKDVQSSSLFQLTLFFMHLYVNVFDRSVVCGWVWKAAWAWCVYVCVPPIVCVFVCVYMCVTSRELCVCVCVCVCVYAPSGCLLSVLLLVTWYLLAMFIQLSSQTHMHTHTHTHAHMHTHTPPVMSLIPSSMATVSEEAGGERQRKQTDISS